MTTSDAYRKTEFFPPHMARALRYAMEFSDPESLRLLVEEINTYPVPEGAPVLSSPFGLLNDDGSVTLLPARVEREVSDHG